MKVKCLKIINEHTQQENQKSPWITVGKEYVVLAIEAKQNKVLFLIASDSNDQPILQDAIQFEVLNKNFPNTWHLASGEIELFSISPKPWQKPGFWDDCYDQDPEALEVYKREAKIIYEQEKEL